MVGETLGSVEESWEFEWLVREIARTVEQLEIWRVLF
jgi:hypothetical protein